MAREYKLGLIRRLVNSGVKRSVGRGTGDERVHMLTTVGRKTGLERSTPVTIVETEGNRWLVAPYGEVGWVHNIRETGTARLTRGEVDQSVTVVEASAAEAAPVLALYLKNVAIVRPYFDVKHNSSLADIAREAHLHPVFRIE